MGVMRAMGSIVVVALSQRRDGSPVFLRISGHEEGRHSRRQKKRQKPSTVMHRDVKSERKGEKEIGRTIEYRHAQEKTAPWHPAALGIHQQGHADGQEEERWSMLP